MSEKQVEDLDAKLAVARVARDRARAAALAAGAIEERLSPPRPSPRWPGSLPGPPLPPLPTSPGRDKASPGSVEHHPGVAVATATTVGTPRSLTRRKAPPARRYSLELRAALRDAEAGTGEGLSGADAKANELHANSPK